MDKITSFQIRRLEVSGFKCFTDLASFDFGEITNILGSNHVGKSSIADAIAFAVTGTTYWGENRIDRLYSEAAPSIEITLDFEDQNGVSHQLIRRRKNDKMVITLDSYKVTQARLNDLFGDRDTFLSIFNPLYFIEVLQDEGKKLLESVLPPVKHEAVLAGLSELDRQLLREEVIPSPEDFAAKLREEVRELTDAITVCEGQSALLTRQRKESGESLTLLQMQKQAVEKEIGKLKTARSRGLDLKSLQAEQEELHLRYDELLRDKPALPDTSPLDAQISEAVSALDQLKTGVYQSKFQPEMEKLSGELKAAYQKHAEITQAGKSLRPGGICPTCRRELTPQAVAEVKAALARQLAEIVASGKNLKTQLAQLQQLDSTANHKWTEFRQADLSKAGATIQELQAARSALLEQYRELQADFDRQCKELSGGIQTIQEKITLGNLDPVQYQKLRELEQQLLQVNADYAAQEAIFNQQADHTGEKIEEIKKAIRQKKVLLTAAANYAAKRAEMTFENLSSGPVKIRLYEVLKTTGEVKDVFRFTYNGRDYRRLSRSERALAGIYTVEMVKRLTGRNYPVFIDDAESIANLSRPTGQAIVSRVVAQAPLSVRPVFQEVPLKKAG